MDDFLRRDQICDELGQLFAKLNKTARVRTKRAGTARGKILDRIGHKLDVLRRLDLFVTLATN
jgi:hypothetical protein